MFKELEIVQTLGSDADNTATFCPDTGEVVFSNGVGDTIRIPGEDLRQVVKDLQVFAMAMEKLEII